MQDLVAVYNANKELIQKFILSSLEQIDLYNKQPIDQLFSAFPSLELVYSCDDALVQNSPNYFRKSQDRTKEGISRSYLLKEQGVRYEFSDPYISTATGKLCMTLAFRTSEGFIFLDFKLRSLLERFWLIAGQKGFNRLNRYAYTLIGGGLIFFGIFVVLYGFYTFGTYLFGTAGMSLDTVFKPVIALTLGLAVYDLGKTILEQEVLPKTQQLKEGVKTKTLLNFSVSIIIALLIEALLVVFKISISDYKDLPYASLLILSLAVLLGVFSYFYKLHSAKAE